MILARPPFRRVLLALVVALALVGVTNAAASGPKGVQRTFTASMPTRAQQTALHGTETRFFGAPDRVWVADGLTQIRGLKLTGSFTFSGAGITLSGSETASANAVIDANGNGQTWGVNTYTDAASGVTCTGTVVGKITGGLGRLTLNALCSDHTHLKGTVQDTSTAPPGQVPPSSVMSTFNGELLSPSQD
jgi:hypothetical protein